MRDGHESTHKRNLQIQIATYNASGSARTEDYLMPLPGVRRPLVLGKGCWVCWTPEAVTKAAFQGSLASARTVQAGAGGNPGHAIRCRSVVAKVIVRGQKAGLRQLLHHGQLERPFSFFVIAAMFDKRSSLL